MRRRPTSVLRSVKELEKFKLRTAEGKPLGRIRDLYFDDQSWQIQQFVAALDASFGLHKQVLLEPSTLEVFRDESDCIALNLSISDVPGLRPATAVSPVCKQYASLALSSPGASAFARSLVAADPHLRSAKAVTNYRLSVAGEFAGTLADFLFDDGDFQIRFLAIEQIIDRRKIQFHIQPQAVERFTWATQRVVLKHLQPVAMATNEMLVFDFTAAVA